MECDDFYVDLKVGASGFNKFSFSNICCWDEHDSEIKKNENIPKHVGWFESAESLDLEHTSVSLTNISDPKIEIWNKVYKPVFLQTFLTVDDLYWLLKDPGRTKSTAVLPRQNDLF